MGVKIERGISIIVAYRMYFSTFCCLLPNSIKAAGLWHTMQMDQQFLHAGEFELPTWSAMGKAFQMSVDCK